MNINGFPLLLIFQEINVHIFKFYDSIYKYHIYAEDIYQFNIKILTDGIDCFSSYTSIFHRFQNS